MYIHIPKEKRTKIDPSGRKGIFIGYSDTSKAYWIYFSGFKKININKDVTFDEESTYSISKRLPIGEVEEPQETRVQGTEIVEAILEDHEYHDMEEPQDPIETLHEKEYHKRKPTWTQELIQEAERYGAPEGMHRERKMPNTYNNYVALLCDIIDKEPSTYEEDA